jgi:2-dehydropantoate 2-reductase
MARRESILIVGTGAMACLFAARLAPHAEITLLGTWEGGLRALKEKGVRLQQVDQNEASHRVKVTSDPEDCIGARHALVLVKSWQTERAAEQLRACLAPEGIALTLQNGLGNLEVLREKLGHDRAALGVTSTGATLLDPGYVRLGGDGPTYIVPHPRLNLLILALRKAGFVIEEAADIDSLLWGKLAINAGINPLTAILKVPNGDILNLPDARELMSMAAEEAAMVAQAKGIRLPYESAAKRVAEVARATARNLSSMLQDRMRAAPTEIDAICGAIVREGQRLGILTPINETFWLLIRALVEVQKDMDRWKS